jgi:NAD(P)H-nitrite reductase large subunit
VAKRRLVVVGNGMSGARLVEDLLARGGGQLFDVTVFGDEPHGNYNRILLSGVLAGYHRPSDIVIHPPAWYAENGVALRTGVRIDQIDLARKTVTAGEGIVEPYDLLVLATGSRPLLPPIDGLSTEEGGLKGGVFLFRTLEDCERIAAYARNARRAAVIGGGLLGIEAARGLLGHGLEVHIIHLAAHLMEAQLDPGAAAVLFRQLEQMGLRIAAGTVTTAVLGNGHATGLAFRNGPSLECDLVVVAAGIRPNVEIARQAGLQVGRGILVGDDLACVGASDVYAIGECAEHRGLVYGLVAPVWEQARVLADRLARRDAGAVYAGSRMSTKLKVAGIDLAVMGVKEPIDDEDEVVSYAEPSRGIYKKLIVHGGRLAGAIIIGDGGVVPSLGQMFAEATPLVDNRAELLFPFTTDRPPPAPAGIPDSARICDCNAVSKAQIVEAVLGGARSLQAVCDITRASTGCGTCRPEVQRIIELACQGLSEPELLVSPPERSDPGPPPDQVPWNPAGDEGGVVTLTKIERIKKEKDGLDILPEVSTLAGGGWEAITEGDRERLKWAGVFFRRQTPGRFMMRVRISNGLTNADQLRTIAEISQDFGSGPVDITTRQQIQIRGFAIDRVPEIWTRLERVGLASMQTGMDNIRTVVGCALAGLSARELIDASPVVHEFTRVFLRNKAFTNLPRKFNVGITGCVEHCTHAESQDLALTPAIKDVDGRQIHGFNVAVGGKMGSGGFRIASPLDVFVEPEQAAALCSEIVLLFRDYGSRAARNKARLAFLVESWGVARLRAEVQNRMGRSLLSSGRDARVSQGADHIGIGRQKQNGLNYVGLAVPVGRITPSQLMEIARVASAYGNGDVRLTTGQNVIIPNMADHRLPALVNDPLLRELPHDPPGAIRGLVACTGIDYCHFALIETKEVALHTARYLADRLPHDKRLSMHWSGCPAGCGNHATADIGLLGKNVRIGDEMVEAVDVFVGGRAGPNAKPGTKVLEDVPCEELPRVLEQLIPYISNKQTRRPAPPPVPAAAASPRVHI